MSTIAENRAAQNEWDDFLRNLLRAATVDVDQTEAERIAHREWLEAPGNEEEWNKFFFPNYYKSEAAPFHKKSTKWLFNHMEGYLVRAWSREMAKDVRTMMETIRLGLTKKKKLGLLVSSSAEKAVLLLKPYKINFESNPRLIAYYGEQVTYGAWTESAFTCKCGMAWVAIGKGQTPRGLRNEDIRPDLVVITDMDTDEDCRNPETIAKDWAWFEKAVYGTRSVSNPFLVIFLGNIIAEDCTINNAILMADRSEVINIEDEDGNSNWPEKNTQEMIARIKSKISYAAFMGEYMNTPITDGKTFPDIYFKKMMPLKMYRFLVAYCDPSYKSGKKNDFKAIALVGKYKDEYHVVKYFCAQTTTAIMLQWYYMIMKFVAFVINVFYLIEWPWIDDTLKLEIQAANKREKVTLPLVPDDREKPEKYFRIESLLEPLNRNGHLWFNIDDKDSPHGVAMRAQFKAFGPKSKAHDDGPDAVEGAVWTINNKSTRDPAKIQVLKAPKKAKRY
ncbi:hypothetical protein MTO98_26620 [Mucilaginibacter sp. SMC90]|uniref:hypothetical protein n=1 Tax=Mucilaginibacter sp. SMC90 TaxID=2929803 RepID=UPI001FB229D8|nr:hypothetical protein [Mucilaginibacter sp. SMC90]UOE47989.1 hypothetical protein MTO98_26620 [Mucilaginibacter sp. SMC90]